MVSILSFSQTSSIPSITTADSLFEQKNYTQALVAYESILEKTGELSPAMLLKMAFVSESLGDYSKSLYYLNLYYQRRPSQQVALKMSDIASRYNLSGYDYGDWDFFLIFYQRYYMWVVTALALLAFWMMGGMIRKKIRGSFIAGRHGMALLFFLSVILIVFNLQLNSRKAIVAEDYSYLMNAPSAGAKLVRVVRKGHRMNVRSETDIWLQTEWAGKKAYIRKQNVWMVE
jgi:tetratricopeptide (TPR) repeat protein